MEFGVGDVASASSVEICGEGAVPSPTFRKRKVVHQEVDDFPKLNCRHSRAAERRAVALGASVDRVLAAAGGRAAEQLRFTRPKFSAATLNRFTCAIPLLLGLLAVAATFASFSSALLSTFVVLPTAFRIWIVVRQTSTVAELHPSRPFNAAPDDDLPVYSIIAPLRGEARVVRQLLSAIEQLDYPPEKLDVIIAVEADDHDTRRTITARKHRIPITVIPIPPALLRTKPKALNVALPFARGIFTVIYDAEDRPERNQLRCALQAFRSGTNDLACVQARLCMDTNTGWLARYFTAEYAGHFDIFLPRLSTLGLPLPLGGSSNHFRTATLREVGGWDAYNVTEDADLGMRLARFGYRSDVINSTTFEEAPINIGSWFRQRTRWLKGWMQTWLVHMREPHRLFRELGPRGFITFQLIVGGNALAALVHPVFLFLLVCSLVAPVWHGYDAATVNQIVLYLGAAMTGYSTSAYLGWLGLSHRDVQKKIRVLMWTPVHWLLLSLAAWRAACQLITRPYFWEKTEHGLDNRPLLEIAIRPLLELERHLTDLEKRGELPQIWGSVRGSAADRRRPPRAVA